MSKKPAVLMILDGFGLNEKHEANAVYEADTPNIDGLMKDYPFVRGYASGLSVGLPDGQMGNSEVGHLNMGAGRIVYQELTRISKEIEDGDFFKNEALLKGMKNVKDNNSSLHLYGLLSDGGVHSHITHLYGLLEMAKREGIEKVYVHCFLDGRDTSPTSGKGFMEQLEDKMKEIGVGQIATVMGRYYVMDRDNRWDPPSISQRMGHATTPTVSAPGTLPSICRPSVRASSPLNATTPGASATIGSGWRAIPPASGWSMWTMRPRRARSRAAANSTAR